MHNVLIISYIAFPIGKLFILPESLRSAGLSFVLYVVTGSIGLPIKRMKR